MLHIYKFRARFAVLAHYSKPTRSLPEDTSLIQSYRQKYVLDDYSCCDVVHMLKVTFNLRDGTFTDIPDDALLFIEDYDKLTPQSANFIKTLHYQTSIRYFITTCYSFISTP